MKSQFQQIYNSVDRYWRGKSAIQKLSKASGSTKEEAEKWLMKQPLYQIYLPPLSPMIFIRQTFFIYLMTNTKTKYVSML